MAAIPAPPERALIDLIYAAIEADSKDAEVYLGRMGSSSIGKECSRAIWLSWRAYAQSQFSGRIYRLFETGHLQEARIVADLRKAGLKVYDVDAEGNQFSWGDDSGHFVTKIDGVVHGVPGAKMANHLLEIKTHNKASFAAVLKHGVKKHKPEHYAQMQISMKLSKLKRGLYVALCKDNEEYYVERLHDDPVEQTRLSDRIIMLRESKIKPVRISDDIESYACKFCDMKQVCYGNEPPTRTCRSCTRAVPGPGGEWGCTLHGMVLTPAAQRLACENYEEL